MSSRSPLIALLILLALPAVGHASNPLLSGYGGPGGGEQVMLGGGMVGGGGGAAGGSGRAADESLRAAGGRGAVSAAAPSASSTLTAAPQKRKSRSSSASHAKTMPNGSTSTKSATTSVGVPQAIAYPTRAGEVGGLPISAGGILALVAAIVLFVLAALGLRRLSVGSEHAPRRPQVSSS